MNALPPIEIKLVASGIEDVQNVFKSLETAVARLEKRMISVQESGSRKRRETTKTEGDERVKEAQKTNKRIIDYEEKKMAELRRQADKWAREEIQITKRKNAELERERKKASALAAAEDRKAQGARDRMKSQIASNFTGSVSGMIGKASGLIGAATALGGGFGVVDSVSQVMNAEGKAKEISIQSEGAASKEQIYKTAKSLGANGVSMDAALAGMDKFGAASGNYDAEKWAKIMPALGQMAAATGASFDDLASAAGIAFGQDKLADADGLLETMRGLAKQGRVGAVDMKDLAQYMTRVSAAAGSFNPSAGLVHNSKLMGAYAQLARQKGGASSSAEATEASMHIVSDIAAHRKQFEAKLGGDAIYDKDNNMKDVETIIRNSILATGGNRSDLQKLGFGERSGKAVEGLAGEYRESYSAAKKKGLSDTDAKKEATGKMNALLDTFLKATLSEEQIRKEAGERMKENDMQLEKAFNELRIQVGEQLVPHLPKLVAGIKELTPKILTLMTKLMELANWVANNPLQAAFLGLAALMTKSITEAFAATFVQGLMEKAMSNRVSGGLMLAIGAASIAAAYVTLKEDAQHARSKAGGQQRAKDDLAEISALEGVVKAGPASMSKQDTEAFNLAKATLAKKKEGMAEVTSNTAADVGNKQNEIHDKYSGLFMFGEKKEKRVELENDVEADKGYLEEARKAGLDVSDKQLEAAKALADAARDLKIANASKPFGPATPSTSDKPTTDGAH